MPMPARPRGASLPVAHRLAALLLAALLVACTPHGRPIATLGVQTGGANILLNGGGNLIAGTLRGPSQILLNGGGNIILNGGGNILLNGGGNIVAQGGGNHHWRTLQALPDELPIAGATVALLDAAGKPVLNAGQSVTAVTDANGHYQLQAPAGASFVVAADLGGGNRVAAIAPHGATSVDAGLVSTLTTDYVLDRLLAGQDDPQAGLDRLDATLEASTRAAAAKAASGATFSLQTLADDQVLGAMDGLRASDAALDAALEKVRAVVLAGQSDLGAGRPATSVSLSRVGGIALGPKGTLFINCAWTGRVWQLMADGTLATAAGIGAGGASEHLAGSSATTAGFGFIDAIAVDASGRLLILEDGRLSRKEANGQLTELVSASDWPKDAGRGLGVLPLSGDRVRFAAEGGLYEAAAGAAPTQVRAFNDQEKARALGTVSSGQLADGQVWLARYENVPAVYRLAAGGTANPQRAYAADASQQIDGVAVDGGGDVFEKHHDGRLTVTTPDGQTRTVTSTFPSEQELGPHTPVALGADGTAYFAERDNHVYRIANGTMTLVAGASAATPAAGARLQDVAIDAPSGVVEAPNGDLYVTETHAHRLLRVSRTGAVSVVAGTGTGGLATDGPAALSPLWSPSMLGMDAKGTVYLLDNTYPNAKLGNFLRTITADGQLHTARAFKLDDESVRDLAVAPDGGVYASMRVYSQSLSRVVYYPPDGGAAKEVSSVTLDHKQPSYVRETIALAPDGALYISGLGRLARWTAATGLTVVEADPVYSQWSRFNGLCVDARGRCYLTDHDRVLRRDPATHQTEVLAGVGGLFFKGTTVDDGLLEPTAPLLTRSGDLLMLDREHRQIKAIAASQLP